MWLSFTPRASHNWFDVIGSTDPDSSFFTHSILDQYAECLDTNPEFTSSCRVSTIST